MFWECAGSEDPLSVAYRSQRSYRWATSLNDPETQGADMSGAIPSARFKRGEGQADAFLLR